MYRVIEKRCQEKNDDEERDDSYTKVTIDIKTKIFCMARDHSIDTEMKKYECNSDSVTKKMFSKCVLSREHSPLLISISVEPFDIYN
jgi:hypothetical protein